MNSSDLPLREETRAHTLAAIDPQNIVRRLDDNATLLRQVPAVHL